MLHETLRAKYSRAIAIGVYSKSDARNAGYTVDTTVYPWLAYKGPRFEPTESFEIPTDAEREISDEAVKTDLEKNE